MTSLESCLTSKETGNLNVLGRIIKACTIVSCLISIGCSAINYKPPFFVNYKPPDLNEETVCKEPQILNIRAIHEAEKWWHSFQTDNPNFYKKIDLGKVTYHLCGSPEKLAEVHDSLYPETPYDYKPYMFTGCDSKKAQVWSIVKTKNGKILFHKWGLGHEAIRALKCFDDDILDAGDYAKEESYH